MESMNAHPLCRPTRAVPGRWILQRGGTRSWTIKERLRAWKRPIKQSSATCLHPKAWVRQVPPPPYSPLKYLSCSQDEFSHPLPSARWQRCHAPRARSSPRRTMSTQCHQDYNSDITGIGVRVSFYLQCFVLPACLKLGGEEGDIGYWLWPLIGSAQRRVAGHAYERSVRDNRDLFGECPRTCPEN